MVESCWLNCSKSAKLTINVFRSGRISSSASRKYLTSPSLFWNLEVIQENVSQSHTRQQLNTSEFRREGREKDHSHSGIPQSLAKPSSNNISSSTPLLHLLYPHPSRHTGFTFHTAGELSQCQTKFYLRFNNGSAPANKVLFPPGDANGFLIWCGWAPQEAKSSKPDVLMCNIQSRGKGFQHSCDKTLLKGTKCT